MFLYLFLFVCFWYDSGVWHELWLFSTVVPDGILLGVRFIIYFSSDQELFGYATHIWNIIPLFVILLCIRERNVTFHDSRTNQTQQPSKYTRSPAIYYIIHRILFTITRNKLISTLCIRLNIFGCLKRTAAQFRLANDFAMEYIKHNLEMGAKKHDRHRWWIRERGKFYGHVDTRMHLFCNVPAIGLVHSNGNIHTQ